METLKRFSKGVLVLVLPGTIIFLLIYHYMYLQWHYIVHEGFWRYALLPFICVVVAVGGSLCCLDTALAVVHRDHFDKWTDFRLSRITSTDLNEAQRFAYAKALDADVKKYRDLIDLPPENMDKRKEYFGSFLIFLISVVDTVTAVLFILGLDSNIHKWMAPKGWLLHKRWPLPGSDGFVIVGMGLTVLILMNVIPNKLGVRFPVECFRKLGWILIYAERCSFIDVGLGILVHPIDSFLDAIGLKARE